jgi:hypothetical protein
MRKIKIIMKRIFIPSALILLLTLIGANFLGLTKLAGYEIAVDRSSARVRKINYFLLIPISSKVEDTLISSIAKREKLIISREQWEVSISRPLLRPSINKVSANGKLLWATNTLSQFLQLEGSSDHISVVRGFIANMATPGTEQVTIYVNLIIDKRSV